MKAKIEVKDRKEASALRAGLADPSVRAFVVIMGTLSALPDNRSRVRVLEYVANRFDIGRLHVTRGSA